MQFRFTSAIVAASLLWTLPLSAQRPPAPPSDLQGLWTNGTATPLQRPAEFADKEFLTPAEAIEYERTATERLLKALPELDVTTAADLNDTYLETQTLKVVDSRRTSLLVDPVNGRLPPLLPQAQERAAKRPKPNYDDPEARDLDERCLFGVAFGSSSAAPPVMPNPFGNNFYQIVQTPQYVMILSELVHDARVIRIGGSHLPSGIRQWAGDSVGHWDGSTLVVDTTNFTIKTHFRGSGERLHVIERFTRTDPTTIQYRVVVDDPDTWATPWTAEIPFKATTDRIFEFACHEGNYSMENSLRGARAQEKEAEAARKK